ncbi:MAG: glycoside hydrolase family 99-like domain-containing protein [bacterium]
MTTREIIIILLLFLLSINISLFSSVSVPKYVFAFYYPWYGPGIHWPEGRTDTPILGEYDSWDPKIIEQHLIWAEKAGIDVFICSWWGRSDYTDEAFSIVLAQIEKLDSKVKICPYIEQVNGDDSAVEEIEYILKNYGYSKAFFKLENKPVIFVYSRAMKQANWQAVKNRIKGEIILIADGKTNSNAFEGIHEYNPARLVDANNLSMIKAYYEGLVSFCRVNNKICALTVIPGYDDSHIRRPKPLIVDRMGTKLYSTLWKYAINSNPNWIIITSFNEWHEGSEIEPSEEYGDTYINLTKEYSLKFKETK